MTSVEVLPLWSERHRVSAPSHLPHKTRAKLNLKATYTWTSFNTFALPKDLKKLCKKISLWNFSVCKHAANLKWEMCSPLSKKQLNGMCRYQTVLSPKYKCRVEAHRRIQTAVPFLYPACVQVTCPCEPPMLSESRVPRWLSLAPGVPNPQLHSWRQMTANLWCNWASVIEDYKP